MSIFFSKNYSAAENEKIKQRTKFMLEKFHLIDLVFAVIFGNGDNHTKVTCAVDSKRVLIYNIQGTNELLGTK